MTHDPLCPESFEDYCAVCELIAKVRKDERIVGLITRQRAEQIGRNIGQYGCVINEQRHLPECPSDGDCICNALRSCEQRVRREEWMASGIYAMGRDDAYDAAIAECISLGHRHIDRINEEAKAAISEQVANQLFMNADGIEFLVGELRAIQEKR